ncbi:MAG: hypothetical protein U0802_20740 [Candidatus Binatia bacterium]
MARGAGAYWYDAGHGFLLAVPSHHVLVPDPASLRTLLWHSRCVGARFSAPLDGPGKLSYQIVCDDREYALEKLSANTRSKVRRGLRRCTVRRVAMADVAAHGRVADRDTLLRQGRSWRWSEEPAWTQYWQAAATTPGIEAWGAFVDDTLAAFLVTVRFEDCVEFLLARSRSDARDAYPNNALIYTVTQELLVQRGVRRITFARVARGGAGARRVQVRDGILADPLRQRVVFHPIAGAVLRRCVVRSAIHQLAAGRRGARGGFWRKAEGVHRFAEEGGLEVL